MLVHLKCTDPVFALNSLNRSSHKYQRQSAKDCFVFSPGRDSRQFQCCFATSKVTNRGRANIVAFIDIVSTLTAIRIQSKEEESGGV